MATAEASDPLVSFRDPRSVLASGDRKGAGQVNRSLAVAARYKDVFGELGDPAVFVITAY